MTKYWSNFAMRSNDPLTEDLRRWGHAQVNRYAFSHAERGVHVLRHARDLSPGTRQRALRELVGRDGGARRRFMLPFGSGRHAPAADVGRRPDPILQRCQKPHDNPEIAVDLDTPDELRWVDRALAFIQRQYPLRALIVRTEFTVSASQAVKARMIAEQYRGSLTLRQYRYELVRSLDLLRGRIAA